MLHPLRKSPMTEPKAKEKKKILKKHGHKRDDPYFWLKEREDKEVLDYLRAENAYFALQMADTLKTQEKLFEEIRARIKEEDETVATQLGTFAYFSRTIKGGEYPEYWRRAGSKEELLLDGNALAKGHGYFSMGGPRPNQSQDKIAYAVDTVGRRFYDIKILEVKSGRELAKIESVTGNFEWSGDSIYYTKQDPKTLRSQWLYRFDLSTQEHTLEYFEKDEKYFLRLEKSLSQKFLYLTSQANICTEVRYQAVGERNAWQVFLPRENKHEYSVSDGLDCFYVLTNWKAKNFRLMSCPLDKTAKKFWKDLVPHRAAVLLESFLVFQDRIVIEQRRNGLTELEILDRKSKKREAIKFPDSAYVVGLGSNGEYSQGFVRYTYESLNRPASVYDYDFQKKKSVRKKIKEVIGYDPEKFQVERVFARAKDGAKIPISLVYKKGITKKEAALFLYAYGSYGYSMDPSFSYNIISLLERGFVYAIAHIRGGSEMGRHWYEHGKLLKKKNTFTDFIASAEFLAKKRYAHKNKIYAMGGSAGGLLMGAVVNMRPDLWKGIIAAVPFVDVVTTMLDDSIPLTTFEYDEWGNPNQQKFYRYMLSYSPYDQVKKQAYPNMLVTTGLHDSQVQYWEPAKWVAKLRKLRTDPEKLLLFRTDMEAGHGGKSGRFQRIKEVAEEFAFLLKLEGKLL